MTDPQCLCVVCGHVIHDLLSAQFPYTFAEFRLLYNNNPYNLSEICVSGVGVYSMFREILDAPLKATSRWDDPGSEPDEWVQFGVMSQPPFENRHGFIFHNCCWTLLEKIYSPGPVPYSRLWDLCRSMPFNEACREGFIGIWSHDYGGLYRVDHENQDPWQFGYLERRISSEALSVADADPLKIEDEDLESLLRGSACDIELSTSMNDCADRIQQRPDVFGKLPIEILSVIACLLPTSDVLNLRLASTSFHFILSTQMFWASRFQPLSERGWLFETRKKSGIDWRQIYKRTTHSCLSNSLLNRKRIWMLLQAIKDIADLEWKEAPPASVSRSDERQWQRSVSGDIKPYPYTGLYSEYFSEGCVRLHWQQVSVPHDISQFAISTVQVCGKEFVSGMRTVSSAGVVVEVGFWRESTVQSVDITKLCGFNVAVHPRGIQAIQVITDSQNPLPWLGSPDNCPKTQHLAVLQPIKSMKLHFDGCKMVSIEVIYQETTPAEMSKAQQLEISGIWYPEFPRTNFFTNESPFFDASCWPWLGNFRPVCWVAFGGIGGKYLKLITGVSLTHRGNVPHSIVFTYNSEEVPSYCRHIGERRYITGDETVHFPIEGPAGERIQAVEVLIQEIRRGMPVQKKLLLLLGFTMHTNRGRRLELLPKIRIAPDFMKWLALSIAPGTTITGFYATGNFHEMGLSSLGVMSEMI